MNCVTVPNGNFGHCGMATPMTMVTVTTAVDDGAAIHAATTQLWGLACVLTAHDMIPQAITSLEVP